MVDQTGLRLALATIEGMLDKVGDMLPGYVLTFLARCEAQRGRSLLLSKDDPAEVIGLVTSFQTKEAAQAGEPASATVARVLPMVRPDGKPLGRYDPSWRLEAEAQQARAEAAERRELELRERCQVLEALHGVATYQERSVASQDASCTFSPKAGEGVPVDGGSTSESPDLGQSDAAFAEKRHSRRTGDD